MGMQLHITKGIYWIKKYSNSIYNDYGKKEHACISEVREVALSTIVSEF